MMPASAVCLTSDLRKSAVKVNLGNILIFANKVVGFIIHLVSRDIDSTRDMSALKNQPPLEYECIYPFEIIKTYIVIIAAYIDNNIIFSCFFCGITDQVHEFFGFGKYRH